MTTSDNRRRIPATTELLKLPAVTHALTTLSRAAVLDVIRGIQADARAGKLAAAEVADAVENAVAAMEPSTLRPVYNGTGVLIHTNLGRAPLSPAARDAVYRASGYVDLEMDLDSGRRSSRGTATLEALRQAVPGAEAVLVVNNAAAALSLAVTALTHARARPEVIISRGELVEIGAGFRLPDLIESTGPKLKEVGTTNRTHLEDYARAIGADTALILKVLPSNYWVGGFTSSVSVQQLVELGAEHDLPVVVDQGTGLLHPEPSLPEEVSVAELIEAGADLVLASGDKLLGGPQAGLIFGSQKYVDLLAKHPLARAFRADKLTLAGVEATLRSVRTPIHAALHYPLEELRTRTEAMAAQLGVDVVEHDGRVGGGGGAGVPLPGYALALPEHMARPLRTGEPAILTRNHDNLALLDLRCIPEEADAQIIEAIVAVRYQFDGAGGTETTASRQE